MSGRQPPRIRAQLLRALARFFSAHQREARWFLVAP